MTFDEIVKLLRTVDDMFDEGDLLGLTGAYDDQYIVQHRFFQRVRADGDERSFATITDSFLAGMVKAFSKKGCFIRLHGWHHGIHFEILC